MKLFGIFTQIQADRLRSCAILTPIVPHRVDENDSWFGGKPRLPKDTKWPEKDGKPFRFACQLNLARLPKNVWAGDGPREGWLAVFFHPELEGVKVLHLRGAIEERDGADQLSAQWASTYATYARDFKIYHLPRWPVRIDEGIRPSSAHATGGEATWKQLKPDLTNPAICPFDGASLTALLEGLEEFFVQQVKHLCRFPAMKKLRQEDLVWMQESKTIAFQSLENFYQVEGALVQFRRRFDQEKVALQLSKLAALPIYEDLYLKNDSEGYCCLEYRRTTLAELPVLSKLLPKWWERYTSRLYWLCSHAYTKDPSLLHPAMRELMEQIWTHEAEGFHGAMGHVPDGNIYTPHGPETDTEVLLELPTSQMQGWIWGDVNSIVLLVKRQALSQGDFSSVTLEVTN